MDSVKKVFHSEKYASILDYIPEFIAHCNDTGWIVEKEISDGDCMQ